ncbi:ABC transporter substrate-binding protein [Candidatus Enterococcus willemsii]|uniref:Spermidine/putrescine ABC transporter substrate-binding protein n=1 Tax=Candidatus Enterococcus willemsii TaxID=1857215 RepID=A0ABQ6Z143_9ENTE|nr:ABC transporter substrate-binding protein [Enterococcus sp. CU12B]KAF1305100.1 spermidine/putrescine ABC transporter substrate-binding protein [Enterococcus sp. CU12B]
MKRLLVFWCGVIVILSVLFFSKMLVESQTKTVEATSKNTVNIFNWGEYIDPELLTAFEKESGYQVIYNTFDSNEAMETKIKQGGSTYDIVFPSESIIPKMIDSGLLLPIDQNKIQGTEDISTFLMNQSFDKKNKYSIPYFWGTIGIMVNTKQVDAMKIKKWSDLWNSEYKNDILMIDGARESIGIALQAEGLSLNELDEANVQRGLEKLAKLRSNVKAVLTDEIKTLMIHNDAPIGIGYSGDAAYVMYENPDIQYIVPEDGGAIWTDNFAIPKTARNLDGAYAFINFMLRPENAKQNAEYVGYATPSEQAKALLPKELTNDEAFYPEPAAMEQMEHYEYLGRDAVEMYNDLFLEWKLGL